MSTTSERTAMTKSQTDPDAHHWEIRLNGLALPDAVYADDARGLVFRVVSSPLLGTIHTLHRGHVEIVSVLARAAGAVSFATLPCPHCGSPQDSAADRCTDCQRLIG